MWRGKCFWKASMQNSNQWRVKKYNGRKEAFDQLSWYFANGHLVGDGKFRVKTVLAGQECPRENEELPCAIGLFLEPIRSQHFRSTPRLYEQQKNPLPTERTRNFSVTPSQLDQQYRSNWLGSLWNRNCSIPWELQVWAFQWQKYLTG